MKILHGILITILIISFSTALQGAFAYESGDSKYTEESGLYQVLAPVMKTSGSHGGSDISSTSDNPGVTGDDATTMINEVSGMIKTIIILAVVIILLIIALVYFFFKKRRTV